MSRAIIILWAMQLTRAALFLPWIKCRIFALQELMFCGRVCLRALSFARTKYARTNCTEG